MIEQFRDEYRWLSNFYPCEVTYEDITYPSVEHFYVAMKSTDPEYRKEVLKLKTAGKAKRKGRELEESGLLRENWDDIKVSIMRYALEQKFSQEPLRSMLIETGDEEIQEGNNWNDTFWGVDLKTGKGNNILGKLLMELRGKLLE